MSSEGTVKFFNTRKGYGFVTENTSQTDYFVHTSDVDGKPLQEGDAVRFDIGEGNDGRPKAVTVTGGTGEEQQRFNNYDQGGQGGGFNNRNSGGYGGNSGGYGGNSGGFGGNRDFGGNSGGYGGNSGGFGGDNGPKKICYNWRDTGECRFGDRCRFSHDAN